MSKAESDESLSNLKRVCQELNDALDKLEQQVRELYLLLNELSASEPPTKNGLKTVN